MTYTPRRSSVNTGAATASVTEVLRCAPLRGQVTKLASHFSDTHYHTYTTLILDARFSTYYTENPVLIYTSKFTANHQIRTEQNKEQVCFILSSKLLWMSQQFQLQRKSSSSAKKFGAGLLFSLSLFTNLTEDSIHIYVCDLTPFSKNLFD